MRAYLFYSAGDASEEQSKQLSLELSDLKVENELFDADTLDGSRLAELYDITRRPAAVVAFDDGRMVHRWLGMLPPASDVSYYMHI
jgi:hypothetical protein